ncbi:MAG TPA: hypothetical protein VNA20_00805 [Frankiaceae bacterium]|nr:hypothetical protein [Frankiaceae bacterium]
MTRRLSLKREALTELTGADLGAVVGAVAVSGASCPICVVDLTRKLGCEGTYNCPTWTC